MKILITGAASGIAYLTALTLAERGHDVYLSCHTDEQVLNVKKKVKDYKNIHVLKIDITNKDDRKKVLDLDVDVLYNHAAVGLGGSILEANMDDIRNSFEVNVFSSFQLLQDVLKQMIAKDKGKIVIMSSLTAIMPLRFGSIYSATKASISVIASCLKKELKTIKSNVDIVLIEPGMYHTGFNSCLMNSKYNDGKYFKKVKDNIYNFEVLFFSLGEKKKLDSIVIQIVRAIEDNKPKSVYRAPISQVLLAKTYNIFKN